MRYHKLTNIPLHFIYPMHRKWAAPPPPPITAIQSLPYLFAYRRDELYIEKIREKSMFGEKNSQTNKAVFPSNRYIHRTL
jgi:hypothetical protein